MSNDVDERVVDEVGALKAILMDELIVRSNESGYPVAVETVIFPSTADDALQQYVCLTLVVELPPGYPDVAPVVLLRNPRGLDDSVLGRIDREVKEKCESYCGQAVIYELIEEQEGQDDPPGPSLLLPPPTSQQAFQQHNSMGTNRGDWRRGGRGGFRGRGSSSSHRNRHGRRHHQAAATSR